MTAGPGGRHDVERDIPEILQEVRVAQTGGQLFFAFLFSVAFAPGFDDLDAHCRARVAGYKVPRRVHVIDQVVRHPSGKPDYRWARATAIALDAQAAIA